MEQQEAIMQALVFGTIGMGILVIAIILFVVVYQKKLLVQKNRVQEIELQGQKDVYKATINSQEIERQRIAKDLHDDIAGDLSAIRISINLLAKLIDQPEEFISISAESKAVLDASIDKVKGIARDLMPPTLEKLGLGSSLKEMANRLSKLTGVPIFFEQQGQISDLSNEQGLAMYRVCQEILNNSLKHSKAKKINIKLTGEPFSILIEDDGVGFDIEKEKRNSIESGGMGLKTIESRLQMVGAGIVMESGKGKGTRSVITFLKPEL